MDFALVYNPTLQGFDLALDGADLATTDTLASAVLVSLMTDRLAQSHEVADGQDRRGWWADTYADKQHQTGSRLWLLDREKQLGSVVQECKLYCEEALAWFVEDALASAVVVTVFAPRMGQLVAMIRLELNTGSRNYRFEFDQDAQEWRLAQEAF